MLVGLNFLEFFEYNQCYEQQIYTFIFQVMGFDHAADVCNGGPLDGTISHTNVDAEDQSSASGSGRSSNGVASSNSGEPPLTGFLSSYLAALYGHGTARCPWSIAVSPGQRIELTLIDFSLSARYRASKTLHGGYVGSSAANAGHGILHGGAGGGGGEVVAVDPGDHVHPDGGPTYCFIYATVTETGKLVGHSGSLGSFTVCAGDERESKVYTSQTNRLMIEISQKAFEDPSANFMIKYTGKLIATLIAHYAVKWEYCIYISRLVGGHRGNGQSGGWSTNRSGHGPRSVQP